ATGSLDHSLKLWDADKGAMVREFRGYHEKEFPKGHQEGIFCAAFSPDGKQIATGGSDRAVKLWNVADGTVVREFVNPQAKAPAVAGMPPPAHPGWVYGVRFTPDGKHLVSAGNAPGKKGYLAVWNVSDGKLLAGEELDYGPVYAIALSPDGKLVVVGCGTRGPDAQDVNS